MVNATLGVNFALTIFQLPRTDNSPVPRTDRPHELQAKAEQETPCGRRARAALHEDLARESAYEAHAKQEEGKPFRAGGRLVAVHSQSFSPSSHGCGEG